MPAPGGQFKGSNTSSRGYAGKASGGTGARGPTGPNGQAKAPAGGMSKPSGGMSKPSGGTGPRGPTGPRGELKAGPAPKGGQKGGGFGVGGGGAGLGFGPRTGAPAAPGPMGGITGRWGSPLGDVPTRNTMGPRVTNLRGMSGFGSYSGGPLGATGSFGGPSKMQDRLGGKDLSRLSQPDGVVSPRVTGPGASNMHMNVIGARPTGPTSSNMAKNGPGYPTGSPTGGGLGNSASPTGNNFGGEPVDVTGPAGGSPVSPSTAPPQGNGPGMIQRLADALSGGFQNNPAYQNMMGRSRERSGGGYGGGVFSGGGTGGYMENGILPKDKLVTALAGAPVSPAPAPQQPRFVWVNY